MTATAAPAWWRRAVVYQVYIRSFADADGDGIGDLAGIRSRLPYLRDLGVDALWVNPWYPSPMVDGGYDVADYRSVDRRFGGLDGLRLLLDDAHALGLRVLGDVVPNHTSSEHPWFREALASPPGSPARDRYVFRDGSGRGGAEPPNNWPSVFGGRAWTRVVEADGAPGQWYLHLFDSAQPDLNWDNPEVRAEFESILAFWFDLGLDGFRIDVAHGLHKDPSLPDLPAGADPWAALDDHPFWAQPATHDVYRAWRRIADAAGGRVLIGEIGPLGPDGPARVASYLRPDELHQAFAFDFLRTGWEADALRAVIDRTLASTTAVGASATWVLSNHDVTRPATRLGRAHTGLEVWGPWVERQPVDRALGHRRARAAALLMLALPGAVYLYQGEELGLDEVVDLPEELLADPTWARSGHRERGRDGCRVPMPWWGSEPPFGFSPSGGAAPWLPQPAAWRALTAEAQAADPASTLELYRAALRLRGTHPGFAGDELRWLASPAGTLLLERGTRVRCAVNVDGPPMPLPPGRTTLLASEPATGDMLAPGAAAWFEVDA